MHLFSCLLALCCYSLPGECSSESVLPPDSGYGTDGPYSVIIDTLYQSKKFSNSTFAFIPDASGPLPLIVFFHGMGVGDPSNYEPFLKHIASRGYCVLFPAYRLLSFPGQGPSYRKMYQKMLYGAEKLRGKIDTKRVGFVGHSFGAGAIPALALKAMTTLGWGSESVFMFLMAPHFVFGITDKELREYPSNVKLIVQVYEDDNVNDPRLGKHLFETIGISDAEKDYITIRSDTSRSHKCVLEAEHGVPFGPKYKWGRMNGFDHYAIFRYFDALSDYTFNGSEQGKIVALGSGSKEQRFMGLWNDGTPVKEAIAGDNPVINKPSKEYAFNWDHFWNPFNKRNRVKFLFRW